MQRASDRSLRSLYGEQTKDYQRRRGHVLQSHRLDRELAGALYQHFGDTPDPYALAFFAHDRPDCIYVDVEAIEANFAEVFDLSIPGSHSFIANGLGNHKTINFPSTASVDDVKQAYELAWRLGCKGLTVYVTGSRQEVVLETRATAEQKAGKGADGTAGQRTAAPGNGAGTHANVQPGASAIAADGKPAGTLTEKLPSGPVAHRRRSLAGRGR